MAPQQGRARSSTSASTMSNRPRPVSRASTTSLNDPDTEPAPKYQRASNHSQMSTIPQDYARMRHHSSGLMAKDFDQPLANPNHGYIIDPTLQVTTDNPRAMSEQPSHRSPSSGQRYSYETKDSQFLVNFNDDQTQDDAPNGEIKKKKGSASSIANDQELRKLFKENKHRDLKDVAAEVLIHERGPRSEKTKQIFAMNWLNTVCIRTNSSVPRNRVFSYYATRCGNERVPPLNPASFGKLVRIIFPGIQTRRLGQRGESKYHYVDLGLLEERLETCEVERMYDVDGSMSARRSHPPGDIAAFPSPSIPVEPNHMEDNDLQPKPTRHLYLDSDPQRTHQDQSDSNMLRRQLKFPTQEESPYAHNEPIELPSITNYLPAGTDPDSANALMALYRTHCISVIDSFRFCKERMFWHHFTSFHGTLTVPVQKLLAHPSVAPWIRECDWTMYQKMIRYVSPLALQVMPTKVIETFSNIAAKLVHHISYTFQTHPQHVRTAKTGPASIFAGLIDRLLRVNATAHAAANMLTNDANRDQMWHDWICFVKPTKVVESTVPGPCFCDTIRILLLEIGDLLGPLKSIKYPGMQQIFAYAQADPGPDYHPIVHNDLDDSSTSGVLDRWTTFLHELPSRFPGLTAADLIATVGEVGSACIRDITMAQALSFGSWWVTKVWVDEMLRWIAEKGGFLEVNSSGMDPRSMRRSKKRTAHEADFGDDDLADSRGGSRPRTGVSEATDGPSQNGNLDAANGFHSRHHNGDISPQTDASASEAANGVENGLPEHKVTEVGLDQLQSHDDSGIGLDLEMPRIPKTPIRLADYGGFVANGNSDPADVVVC